MSNRDEMRRAREIADTRRQFFNRDATLVEQDFQDAFARLRLNIDLKVSEDEHLSASGPGEGRRWFHLPHDGLTFMLRYDNPVTTMFVVRQPESDHGLSLPGWNVVLLKNTSDKMEPIWHEVRTFRFSINKDLTSDNKIVWSQIGDDGFGGAVQYDDAQAAHLLLEDFCEEVLRNIKKR